MSKIIKSLSVLVLALPILLCIIAQFHHFDFGRIMIDAVLLLTAIVGLRVVFEQLKIKENEIVFKSRQTISDFWILIIMMMVVIIAGYLCVMAIIQPSMEYYQMPAFYLFAIFGFRMNHKAVFASEAKLYYDFKEYPLGSLKLLEHRDDGGYVAFHLQAKKHDFWVVLKHREGKRFLSFLKGAL